MSFDVNIVGTGSTGNLNIIDEVIAIDCGLPRRDFLPFAEKVEIIMISHEHGDHLNFACLNWLLKNRPAVIKYGLYVNQGTYAKLQAKAPAVAEAITHIIDDEVDTELRTSKGKYRLRTYTLHHNVENQGFILENSAGEKLIHATDTFSMEDAPDEIYDYFLVEGNYDEEKLDEVLFQEDLDVDNFFRASQNLRHLSNQQCHAFILNHSKPGSIAWQLHESETYGMKIDLGIAGKVLNMDV